MDTKITLRLNNEVLQRAHEHAKMHGISIDELTEKLLCEAISGLPQRLASQPISDWVYKVAEGRGEYVANRKRNDLRNDYYSSR